MNAAPADKNTLRQDALRKRLSLPTAARKEAAQAMAERFLQTVKLKPGAVIAGYWPVNGEINVLPLLTQLQGQGYACALPQMSGKDKPLLFGRWSEKTPMKTNAFEIKEPEASAPAVMPDIVIVPLLAFDDQLHRLGYGAGFYDRTFTVMKKIGPFTAVGVAYDVQKIGKVPAEAHDRALDMVVTDRHVYTKTA